MTAKIFPLGEKVNLRGVALCYAERGGSEDRLASIQPVRLHLNKLIEVSVHLMLEEHTLWEGIA